MGRAMSIAELIGRRRQTHRLDGEFAGLIGSEIELSGAWFIWGGSNSGKTTFATQLGKYMTRFGRVAYDSIEEGDSLSMVMAMQRTNMQEVARRVIFLNAEPITELRERLAKQKSPDIVIIDSFQYAGLKYDAFKQLLSDYPRKLFIFVSQANGKEPRGSDAEAARYAAHVKIWVEGCRAFATSRYGGGRPYTIWQERASEYWNDIAHNDE